MMLRVKEAERSETPVWKVLPSLLLPTPVLPPEEHTSGILTATTPKGVEGACTNSLKG